MNTVYDTLLLLGFIVVICVFMYYFQKRTERIKERNAKIFERTAASPGNCVLEYEDIVSSEMDNDVNDDINAIQQQNALKQQMYRKRVVEQKLNQRHDNILVIEDRDKSDEKTDADIFSDSTDDDGMSMARMREEYYKSQTVTKRFADLVEDIYDMLKLKQMQVQRKFTKKKPTIVIPMAIKPQLRKKHMKSGKLEDIREEDEDETESHSVESESDEKVIED